MDALAVESEVVKQRWWGDNRPDGVASREPTGRNWRGYGSGVVGNTRVAERELTERRWQGGGSGLFDTARWMTSGG